MGLEAPSPASLARIFRQEGVARAEPSKRPRAAWRRFVYPAPNACWQLDATEYVLAGGRKAVIFQLQDDHWRLAVAWLVAPGDGRSGGHRRLRQGRSRPGRAPGARAADNGAAPGPSRRPVTGPPGRGTCAPWASNPSPADPTGPPPRARTSASTRPCSATRAGSPWPTPSPSSRSRSTASTTSTTPSAPTRACPGASPRSRPRTPARWPGHPDRAPTPTPSPPAAHPRATRPPGADRRTGAGPSPPAASAKPAITRNGTVHIGGIAFLVRRALAGHRTTAIWDATTITFADVHGEVLIQYNWPPEGVTYVSHHPPDPTNQRGGRGRRRPQPSPKS